MVIVVDGNNICYAGNCVSRLSTPDGRPTQAIFNFFRSMHALCETFQPRKIFIAWDGGRSAKRLEIYPGYKASRGKDLKPQQHLLLDEFKLQAPVVQENIIHIGAHSISGPGVEADDLIATLAQLIEQQEDDCIICSSDKDFLQLVSPRIKVLRGGNLETAKFVDEQEMIKSFNLRPDQWLDFRCLTGDDSDEIKGIKGVGDVTATKVLNAYGSIDNLFHTAATTKSVVTDKRMAAILAGKDILDRNKKLMGLKGIKPEFIRSAQLRQPEYNPLKLKALFGEYHLNTLLMDFSRWSRAFQCLESVSGCSMKEKCA